MGKFVQQRSYEIRLVAVVVVEAEIEVERAAEAGGDVVLRGDEVGVGEFVCQCNVIPRVCQRRTREVSHDCDRAGTAEHTCSKHYELSANTNRDVAVEPRGPDFSGALKSNQALLTQRGTVVTTDRRPRRGIVEADVRRIDVDDYDLGWSRKTGLGGQADDREHKND